MMYNEEDVGMSFMKLNNILNGTEELADKYEIEGVVAAIQQMSRKVDFLKELKKRRAAVIDQQVSAEEENISKLEDAIKNCMAKSKDKSLDFPGVGKVSLRKSKGTWGIIDEDGLKGHLEALGKFSDVSEQSWKFKKKDLNILLDELERNNNTSQFVAREPGKESVSITFPKEHIPTVSAPSAVVQDSFDKLDI